MSKQSKAKVESGAQLLARLGPRPSLQGLTSALFGFDPSPGDVIELYGSEGVGKTELLLHVVTTAVLPSTWHNRHLHGNQAQVIWLDTDLKFSVLRLAVLLEQRILSAVQREDSDKAGTSDGPIDGRDDGGGVCTGSNARACGDTATVKDGTLQNDFVNQKQKPDENTSCRSVNNECKSLSRQIPSTSGRKRTFDSINCDAAGDYTLKRHTTKHASGTDNRGEDIAGKSHSSVENPAVKVGHSFPGQCGKAQNFAKPGDDENVNVSSATSKSDHTCVGQPITGDQVEALVKECLERVHVVHCVSSQQLICTLHSLEATIAANRNISLLIIDPVSAFFWSDKCRDLDRSSSFLLKMMSYVTAILKKIAQTYGVLVVVAKQALLKPKQYEEDVSERFDTSSVTRCGRDSHVEFLGKAWSELVTRRFICTKTGNASGKYGLITGGNLQKCFMIDENGVQLC